MPATARKKKRQSSVPPEIQEARNTLRRRGWTQTEAAEQLKVTPGHLCLVLNGHRDSRRILDRIQSLPENPNPA